MTRTDSAPEFDPRHRIIGAIVVIALAVIFIPMVLSDAPRAPGPRAAGGAIGAPAPVNRVVVRPVPQPGTQVALSAPAPAPEAQKEPAPPQPAAAAPESANPARAAPAPVEAGWVVQVATFANEANAERLVRRLRADGESILTERVQLDGGEGVRVRVGPFAERDAALEAQARIRKEVGLKGVVRSYP